MELHSKETGKVKTDISNAYNMELIESVVNEAEKFKSTKDFLDFCEEIDGMPEVRIKRIMGKDYIDTPGGFRDEADDYDNDIEEYMISNMGKSDFEALKTWWENNVQESTVNEGDMTKFYDGFIVLDFKNKNMYNEENFMKYLKDNKDKICEYVVDKNRYNIVYVNDIFYCQDLLLTNFIKWCCVK
jgi:hypothetical protein